MSFVYVDGDTSQDNYGGKITADATSKIFSASMKAKYAFETETVDIAPYAGLRFSFVHMDAMTARSGGSVIMNSDSTTSTEVLDRVNYSAKLGLTGEAGRFGFGVGVSYTGSSNADNYAAMANVRWRF
ncbi:MAG: autotransporter outer membrane beta-barrel domain-containing protein [Sutterella sp.]|nr:autotransporter domain-containing protein [Sutterella sp.]MDO5533006.1 autotransporter outer membrane beta-barrel domain-containing protein [Sutterella sp.]